jgi:hypothetical protein
MLGITNMVTVKCTPELQATFSSKGSVSVVSMEQKKLYLKEDFILFNFFHTWH